MVAYHPDNTSAPLNNNSIMRNISNLNNELSINIDSPPLSSMLFKLLIEICLHKLILDNNHLIGTSGQSDNNRNVAVRSPLMD